MVNTPEEIRLTFPFSFWDRVYAAILLTSQRKLSILLAAVWPVIGIVFLVFVLAAGRPLDTQVWAIFLGCLAFYPLIVLIGVGTTHITNRQMREPFTYVFNDAGVHVSAKSYEFTHRWSTISQVKTLGGYLLFFFSPGCAHCIPLPVVRQADAMQSLLTMARANGARTDGT